MLFIPSNCWQRNSAILCCFSVEGGQHCHHLSDARYSVRHWWKDVNTTEQALNSWNLHSHCLTLRQLCEVGINAPVLQMRKPGLRDVKKMSLGHTFVSPQISCSSWDEHWTPFAKAVCVLEISTTTMLPFSRRDFHFPPAVQINFPLPADPGRGWRQLHHRRAKHK